MAIIFFVICQVRLQYAPMTFPQDCEVSYNFILNTTQLHKSVCHRNLNDVYMLVQLNKNPILIGKDFFHDTECNST